MGCVNKIIVPCTEQECLCRWQPKACMMVCPSAVVIGCIAMEEKSYGTFRHLVDTVVTAFLYQAAWCAPLQLHC